MSELCATGVVHSVELLEDTQDTMITWNIVSKFP